MKKNSTHENFERFLKDAADELQLRPAATVWRHIESRLNRRRRWVLFTSAFFLVTATLFGYLIIDHSKNATDPFVALQTTQKKVVEGSEPTNQNALAPTVSPQQPPLVADRSRVGFINKISVDPSTPQSRSQLFQKPMLAQPLETIATIATAAPDFTATPVDEYQPFNSPSLVTQATARKAGSSNLLSIESVVNLYVPKSGRHKSEFQLYFTPTISYRRLTENKTYLRTMPQNLATINLAALYDVNSMVTHKPDLGLELGFAFKFPVTRALKVRSGMQFNITRYDIKAFTYRPERTTIALNNRARGVDSVNTISQYRNFYVGRADWLQNFYFQVSAPVGVELALNYKKKTKFGIAGTLQPTYVLGDRAYLISTDYKNYSQVPWLIRRWNVNTSLETFISYSTGKLRWQVGPQMRYQLLSSFVEKYPVKENLFDFGLKMGVSLDKK